MTSSALTPNDWPKPRRSGCVNEKPTLDACEVGKGCVDDTMNGSSETLLLRSVKASWLPTGSVVPIVAE